MLKKNRVKSEQIPKLLILVKQFLLESNLKYNQNKFVLSTVNNICLGIEGVAKHDIWTDDETSLYCLGKEEIDADGERVYTAYQLYVTKQIRSLGLIRQLIKFLRFYSQKQGYKRLYIVSSRLDRAAAYKRGVGRQFREKTFTLVEEF